MSLIQSSLSLVAIDNRAAKLSNRLRPPAALLILVSLIPTLGSAAYATSPLPASKASQPANFVDIRVNQTTREDQQEPTLAVDPTNASNIIAAAKDWRTGPKQVWDYRSTDGGRTWVDGYPGLLPGELPNQSDPVTAFDSSGAAYLAVLGYNQSDFSVGGLFVARTTDVGATWQHAVEVSANSNDVFNDKEWLTVDRSSNRATQGNVYVTWTLFTQVSPTRQRSQIVLSRSTDGGKTFSPRQAISPEAQDSVQGSYPVVGPAGELYVLYYYSSGSSQNENEKEDGQGKGSSTAVIEQAMEVSQKPGNALYMVRSAEGGASFGQPVKVATVTMPPSKLAKSDFRVFVLPVLAADPNNGALYAIWNDFRAGDSDVMLATSKDAGRTWDAPRRVNDDTVSSGSDQFFPTAVVGKDSTLYVYWLDTRDDAAKGRYRPYYTRSTDGGKRFANDAPLSASLSDPKVGFEGTLLGDYIALDVSGDGGRVYAAWVDTRNGDQDIYFTTFDSASTAPEEPILTPTPAGTPAAVPSPQPLTGFNNRAFITGWEGADRAVLTGKAQRPWVWGPTSFAAANEPYKEGQQGERVVLYFDKARMEINNPHLDPSDPGYVTSGLLVVELVSGRVQVGDAEFEAQSAPSNAPVTGDLDSPDALTYASLAPVASLKGDNRSSDRTGQGVTAVLHGTGRVTEDQSKAPSVHIAIYEPHVGHNIPDVFWSFMNAAGPVYNGRSNTYSNGKVLDWVSALGYPITEPYWVTVKVGGVQKSVLVQAFQRRVLTYVADNPPGWQVEMGNVGRHYFDWRYGTGAER